MLKTIAIGLNFCALAWIVISATCIAMFDPDEDGSLYLLFWTFVAIIYAGYFSCRLWYEKSGVASLTKAFGVIASHTFTAVVVGYILIAGFLLYQKHWVSLQAPGAHAMLAISMGLGFYLYLLQILWSGPLYMFMRFIVQPLAARFRPEPPQPLE